MFLEKSIASKSVNTCLSTVKEGKTWFVTIEKLSRKILLS